MKDSQLTWIGVGALGIYILYPTISEWISKLNPIPVVTSQKVTMDKSAKATSRLTTGLENTGNFCFMNSNIQAMASLPGTFNYLSQVGYLCSRDAVELAPVSSALFYFVRQLNQPVSRRTTISPEPLIAAIEKTFKTRMSRRQHDAHELLHLLLEVLQKEHRALSRYVANTSQPAHDPTALLPEFPYQGTLVDQILCGNCHTRSETPSKYLVLSLSVPQKRSVSLDELLTELTLPEYIQDYVCTHCRVKTLMASQDPRDAELQRIVAEAEMPLAPEIENKLPRLYSPITKSQRFNSTPPLLCIHLSRSIFSNSFAARNSCKVEFPLQLTLPGTKATYRLHALIRHSGTHQIGHYECNRRKNTEFWSKINWSSLYESAPVSEYETIDDSSLDENSSSPQPIVNSAEPLPFPARAEPSLSISTEPAVAAQPGSAKESTPNPPQSSKQWWAISDDEVRETTSRAVLSLQSGAYLLFYQRE